MPHSKQLIGFAALLSLLAAGCIRLGLWQLDRADENRSLEQGYSRAADEPPVDQPIAAADLTPLRYRRIELHGRYRPEQQILLDNMTHAGQPGYQVLTPFDIGQERLVLVNRGWVPAAADRRQLPVVAVRQQPTAVAGRIDRLPRSAFAFEADALPHGEPLTVLSFPDYDDIETVLERPVYPFQLLLDPDATEGFVRDWAPPANRDERNVAYAVQWFGLAALALILAVVIPVRSVRRHRGADA